MKNFVLSNLIELSIIFIALFLSAFIWIAKFTSKEPNLGFSSNDIEIQSISKNVIDDIEINYSISEELSSYCQKDDCFMILVSNSQSYKDESNVTRLDDSKEKLVIFSEDYNSEYEYFLNLKVFKDEVEFNIQKTLDLTTLE